MTFIILEFRRLEVLNESYYTKIGVGRAAFLLEALWEDCVFALFMF